MIVSALGSALEFRPQTRPVLVGRKKLFRHILVFLLDLSAPFGIWCRQIDVFHIPNFTTARGSRLAARGSRLAARGSRLAARGSRLADFFKLPVKRRCVSGLSLLLSVFLGQPAAAREGEDADVPSGEISTDAAADQAEFLARNVPATPLPAGSPKLDVLRKRAADLRKQQAAYLENVASGKTDPFAELAEARPQHEKDLAALMVLLSGLTAEEDPEKRELASKALFAALQPIGPFLEDGNYVEGYLNILSPEQVTELARLEAAWEAAAVNHPENTRPLSLVSPGQLYTLTHLSVPLVVKCRPDSTMLFRAQSGGLFSNKLPIIEVKTDRNGFATAFWSTKGDAVADCPIDLRSDAAPTDGSSFNITVVKPVLQALPGPPALR